MSEPTVQVPVSLIKEADEVMREGTRHERYAMAARLDALLSQPTQAAEASTDRDVLDRFLSLATCPDDASRLARLRQALNLARQRGLSWPLDQPAAELPRIEDLAPGTTFTARLGLMDGLTDRRVFMRVDGVDVVDDAGARWHPQDVDPSTIRDVTPPAVAE